MFFWISLILFIISAIAIIYNIKNCRNTWIADICFITFAFVIISIIFFILIYTPAEAKYNSKLEEQKSLEYRVSFSTTGNNFCIVNIDLINQEVQDWNKNLAYNKTIAHNFWFGIYIPNYWDDLNYIEYDLNPEEKIQPYEHIINDPNILYLNADQ